jgi:hypothetical protein
MDDTSATLGVQLSSKDQQRLADGWLRRHTGP